jgi:flavin-dependent thymidylate synthase
MKVVLKSYTQNALELLVGTKTTRMRGKSPEEMSNEELYDHFQYMLDTIKSPFEFVDFIFHIEGVSKNFTHQFVRTRTGAYQQETSRALEVGEVITPENFEEGGELFNLFQDGVADANAHYKKLIAAGAQLQDARAVIPSNMATVIDAKFNLRTLSDMAKLRLCARTQGEYQEVFRAMRKLVLDIYPWAAPLLEVHCVATGTCAFPRWGGAPKDSDGKVFKNMADAMFNSTAANIGFQCPHYDPRMDLAQLKKEVRVKFWSREEIAQANPVASGGKSM